MLTHSTISAPYSPKPTSISAPLIVPRPMMKTSPPKPAIAAETT